MQRDQMENTKIHIIKGSKLTPEIVKEAATKGQKKKNW